MPSRRLSVVVTIVLVFALAVVAIAPAFAAPAAAGPGAAGALPVHARLVGSTPADGSTVETATQVTLEFNEEVNPDFVAVRVAGPDGAETDGVPVVEGRAVTQPLAGDLPAGAHTVTYRVVSADGHPISGSVTFTTTAAPAGTAPPSATASATGSAGSSASAPPAPTPTPAASPVPAATESGDGSTPWLLVALGAVLAVLALVVAWRVLGRSGAPAATEDGTDGDAYLGGPRDGRDGAVKH